MKKVVQRIIIEHRDKILYLVFGVFTAIINYGVYYLCTRGGSLSMSLSVFIAWISAVIFAYCTNKHWVFKSKVSSCKLVFIEFASFVGVRIFSMLIEMGMMAAMTEILHIYDLVAKIIANVVVVLTNYFFSKILVFRDRDNSQH